MSTTTTLQGKRIERLERIRNTAIGQIIQSQQYLGITHELIPFTTLNEKLNVNIRNRISENERYKVGYYVIGDNGHINTREVGRPDIAESVDHSPLDAAPYNMMPFVLRPLSNDLTAEQRLNYRLRVKRNINGVNYWAYYAKKVTFEPRTNILLETITSGVKDVREYTYTSSNLSPTPPELPVARAITASNTKMKVSTAGSLIFSEEDVNEYLNVAKIIYGSERFAIISEIGLVAGIEDDRYVEPETREAYQELKGAVITSFISVYQQLATQNGGFEEKIELGEKEPLATNDRVLTTVGTPVNPGALTGS